MSLPRITVPVRRYNRDTNRYDYCMREVEVLTLHLNTGQMRVRILEDGKPTGNTADIAIGPFFEYFKIEPID